MGQKDIKRTSTKRDEFREIKRKKMKRTIIRTSEIAFSHRRVTPKFLWIRHGEMRRESLIKKSVTLNEVLDQKDGDLFPADDRGHKTHSFLVAKTQSERERVIQRFDRVMRMRAKARMSEKGNGRNTHAIVVGDQESDGVLLHKRWQGLVFIRRALGQLIGSVWPQKERLFDVILLPLVCFTLKGLKVVFMIVTTQKQILL